MNESIIFAMLGSKNLGPQLFAAFPGGRLEEYIPVKK